MPPRPRRRDGGRRGDRKHRACQHDASCASTGESGEQHEREPDAVCHGHGSPSPPQSEGHSSTLTGEVMGRRRRRGRWRWRQRAIAIRHRDGGMAHGASAYIQPRASRASVPRCAPAAAVLRDMRIRGPRKVRQVRSDSRELWSTRTIMTNSSARTCTVTKVFCGRR